MIKHLFFLLISLNFLGTANASENNSFLFQQQCPDIIASQFRSEKITTPSESLNMSIFWNLKRPTTDVPYALVAPLGFQVAMIQVFDRIKDLGLEQYFPDNVEVYSFGNILPGSFSDYTAIICKDQQDAKTMRILVRDEFLSNSIIFKRLLAHEFIHYIAIRMHKKFPAWFEEGLALQFENTVVKEEKMGWAAHHLAVSPWIPLQPSFALTSASDKRSFYGHALLFVRYLAKDNEKFFLDVLNSSSSQPKEIFPNFNKSFKDFEIGKFINQVNYMGVTTEELSRYYIYQDQTTNRKPHALAGGSLSASVTSAPEADAYYITVGDSIQISKSPMRGSFILSIAY